MKIFTKTMAALLLTLCWVTGVGQTPPSAINFGTFDTLYSQVLKENRPLIVYAPTGAANPANQVRYPVVYLLDAGVNFLTFVGMLEYLSEVNQICPPMMVIGLFNTDRMRDFTPTRISSPGPDSLQLKTSGGAENFTAFLEKELIPYVDAHYATLPDRMLVGNSLGGLFAINTFVDHTHLFKQYVSIDPSLTWDDQKLLKKYLAALAQRTFTNKAFFLTAANFAGMDSTRVRRDTTRLTRPTRAIFAFADALSAQKKSGLDWACRYFPDESHFSVPVPSAYAALKFIFRRKTIQLTASQLKAMEGTYKTQFEPGKDVFLQVRAGQGYLTVKQLWDSLEFQVIPDSALHFFCKLNPFTISFINDSRGHIKQALVMNSDLWTKVEK